MLGDQVCIDNLTPIHASGQTFLAPHFEWPTAMATDSICHLFRYSLQDPQRSYRRKDSLGVGHLDCCTWSLTKPFAVCVGLCLVYPPHDGLSDDTRWTPTKPCTRSSASASASFYPSLPIYLFHSIQQNKYFMIYFNKELHVEEAISLMASSSTESCIRGLKTCTQFFGANLDLVRRVDL